MSHSGRSRNAFLDSAEACFRDAAAAGLPLFLTDANASSPLNATPYLAAYARFREIAQAWPGRARFVTALDAVRARVERLGLAIEAVLIGGSFTELDKAEIGDVDCLMFYRVPAASGEAALARLSEIQRGAKARGVDVRFVPLDGDPLVLIKLISYFSIFYGLRKGGAEVVRSLLLLDCRHEATTD